MKVEFDPYELVRGGGCTVRWLGMLDGSGEKVLSPDERGCQELREKLEWGKKSGEVIFSYPHPEGPSKCISRPIFLP